MERIKSAEIKEQERLNKIADELDGLQREKNIGDKKRGEPIPWVDWIVQDLRAGNFKKAQVNYNNQCDKYDELPEILALLKRENIAEETIYEKYKRLKKEDPDLDYDKFVYKELTTRYKRTK
ncbi:MAG: hypothetical protein HY225_02585 [Candidatus Vogelbacteria bacterium]|nr:hypothetical protein [Candidatus Vogelbacteria bacterium]